MTALTISIATNSLPPGYVCVKVVGLPVLGSVLVEAACVIDRESAIFREGASKVKKWCLDKHPFTGSGPFAPVMHLG